MQKQTVEFATVVKNGVVEKIGRSSVYVPKTKELNQMDKEQLEILQLYCENDMRLLKKLSQSIFMRFSEPFTRADYDDFYSIANMTLWQCCKTFDFAMGVNFEGFLYSCLQKKFKTELTRRHRQKRALDRLNISLDAVNSEDEGYSLLSVLPSDFDTFEEVIKQQDNEKFADRVQKYISRLSTRQVNILNLMIDGYKPIEIRKILQMDIKEYTDNMQIIRAFENVKYLF